ncbi:unnamed protein product [Blepharisma stoltei]|uniref:Uncharacterized protein n=1 Tax=Blepharisma stoltei TaxID=1481888 RepID=A0AAU9J7H8_9CILI|nr:unnamed protein product [Blepharisma stoltei]
MHHENMKVDLLKNNHIKTTEGYQSKKALQTLELLMNREKGCLDLLKIYCQRKDFTEKEIEHREIIGKLRKFQAKAEFSFLQRKKA